MLKQVLFVLLVISVQSQTQNSSFPDGEEDLFDDGSKPIRDFEVFPFYLNQEEQIHFTLNHTKELENDHNSYEISYYPVKFFKFQLEEIIPDEDLFFIIKGRKDFSHSPLFYVSKTNTHPGLDSSDYNCGLYGVDLCTFPSSRLQKDQLYYLGIYCSHNCTFIIKISYLQSYFFNLGDSYVFKFNQTQMQEDFVEFRIYIPPLENLTHILVEAFLKNPSQVNETFHIYGRQGNFPPTTASYDYYGYQINQGEGILIEKDDGYPIFKRDANYTFIIAAPSNSLIYMKSQGFGETRQIYLYNSIVDITEQGRVDHYDLTINPAFFNSNFSNFSISFDLEPYFGNPDLFVNFGSRPQTLSESDYVSNESDGTESLSISWSALHKLFKEREFNEGFNSSKLFISVWGKTYTSFRLLAYYSNYKVRMLTFECAETGYIEQGDFENYQLYVMGLISQTITIDLIIVSGDADLYVRICDQAIDKNCLINEQSVQNDSNVIRGTGEQFKTISFQYNQTKCQSVNCVIMVAVANHQEEDLHYRLIGKHPDSVVSLKEHQPLRQQIGEGITHYYQFSLYNDANVEKVSFLLDTIIGDVEIFISQKVSKPTYQHSDFQGYFDSDIFEYSKENTQNLSGTYHLSVYAYSSATFSLSVDVYRTKTEVDQHYNSISRIIYGVAYYGSLKQQSVDNFYFYNDEDYNRTNFNLYFNQLNKKGLEKENDTFQCKPKATLFTKGEGKETQIVKEISSYSSNMFYSLSFETDPDQKYFLRIIFSSSKQCQNITFRYSFMVTAPDIQYLEPSKGSVMQQNVGETQKFELYLQQESTVLLEVFECFGKVTIEAARNFQEIENGTYAKKSSRPSKWLGQHTLIQYDNQQVGPFYYAVISNRGFVFEETNFMNNNSLWMIIPHVLSSNTTLPYDIYYSRSQGSVETNENSTSINYYTLDCNVNCSEYQQSHVHKFVYILHVTNKKGLLQYYSKCQLEHESLLNLIQDQIKDQVFHQTYYKHYNSNTLPNTSDYFQLAQLPPNQKLYAQLVVMIYVKNLKISQPFSFLYESFDFGNEEDHIIKDPNSTEKIMVQKDLVYYIIILVLLIIIIFIGIYYVWLKKHNNPSGAVELQELPQPEDIEDMQDDFKYQKEDKQKERIQN